MTPPASATVTGRTQLRRPPAPLAPRRVSGPATRRRSGSVSVPSGAPGIALRVARRAATLPDARVLDRLIRGRLWIGLLAAGLIGIVFMQISLLKLNTGIGRAVQTAETLDQQNDALRVELSRMAGGERVLDGAEALGYVVPATGQPQFLDARRASAARAAAAITAPDPIDQLPLGMIDPSDGGTAGLVPADPAGASAPTTATSADAAAGTAAAAATAPATAAPAGTAATTAAIAPAGAAATAAPAVAPPATSAPAAGAAATGAPATPAPAAGSGSTSTGGGAAAPLG